MAQNVSLEISYCYYYCWSFFVIFISKYKSTHFSTCGNMCYLMIQCPHMQWSHLLFSYTILSNDFSYPTPLSMHSLNAARKKTSNSKASSLSCKVIPLAGALYRKRAMYSLATFLSLCSLSLGARLGVSEYSAFFAQIKK